MDSQTLNNSLKILNIKMIYVKCLSSMSPFLYARLKKIKFLLTDYITMLQSVLILKQTYKTVSKVH